jgi:hypothetical protein
MKVQLLVIHMLHFNEPYVIITHFVYNDLCLYKETEVFNPSLT